MRNPNVKKEVRSKHIRALERRLNFLDACVATDNANTYELAERDAIQAVLAFVKVRLEEKSLG
jgi:hypothetical protein